MYFNIMALHIYGLLPEKETVHFVHVRSCSLDVDLSN